MTQFRESSDRRLPPREAPFYRDTQPSYGKPLSGPPADHNQLQYSKQHFREPQNRDYASPKPDSHHYRERSGSMHHQGPRDGHPSYQREDREHQGSKGSSRYESVRPPPSYPDRVDRSEPRDYDQYGPFMGRSRRDAASRPPPRHPPQSDNEFHHHHHDHRLPYDDGNHAFDRYGKNTMGRVAGQNEPEPVAFDRNTRLSPLILEHGECVGALEERERFLRNWDAAPPGFSKIPADKAKLTGLFPPPGNRAKLMDYQPPSLDPARRAMLEMLASSQREANADDGSGSAYGPLMNPFAKHVDVLTSMTHAHKHRSLLDDQQQPQLTGQLAKQAKRLYIGNVPLGTQEDALKAFLNRALLRLREANPGFLKKPSASHQQPPDKPENKIDLILQQEHLLKQQAKKASSSAKSLDPASGDDSEIVLAVQVQPDKNFAFADVASAEDATLAQKLDGMASFEGSFLKIGRPKEYKDAMAALQASQGPKPPPALPHSHGNNPAYPSANLPPDKPGPTLMTGREGGLLTSSFVTTGDHYVVLGGFPEFLSEAHVRHLVQPFGDVRTFVLLPLITSSPQNDGDDDDHLGRHVQEEPEGGTRKRRPQQVAVFDYTESDLSRVFCEGVDGLAMGPKHRLRARSLTKCFQDAQQQLEQQNPVDDRPPFDDDNANDALLVATCLAQNDLVPGLATATGPTPILLFNNVGIENTVKKIAKEHGSEGLGAGETVVREIFAECSKFGRVKSVFIPELLLLATGPIKSKIDDQSTQGTIPDQANNNLENKDVDNNDADNNDEIQEDAKNILPAIAKGENTKEEDCVIENSIDALQTAKRVFEAADCTVHSIQPSSVLVKLSCTYALKTKFLVQYATYEEAEDAIPRLAARRFGDRALIASYFPNDTYTVLTAQPNQDQPSSAS